MAVHAFPPAAERYLAELDAALKRTPGSRPAAMLADARERIESELGSLDDCIHDEHLFDWLAGRLGLPDKLAADYAAAEPPVRERPGYAPGWRVECVRCGRSAPASRIGWVRIGAWSKGKWTLGWCRRCGFLTIARVVRDLPPGD